jgi:hypothetical protein
VFPRSSVALFGVLWPLRGYPARCAGCSRVLGVGSSPPGCGLSGSLPAGTAPPPRCLLNLGLQQSGNRDHAVAGRKLQVLLPRMILRTLSMRSTQKAAVEMRRRCTRYLDGDWQALIAECPAPIGVAQRLAMETEADDRRDYQIDKKYEHSVTKIKDGRPSQSVQALVSHGMAENAFDDLLAVHFDARLLFCCSRALLLYAYLDSSLFNARALRAAVLACCWASLACRWSSAA